MVAVAAAVFGTGGCSKTVVPPAPPPVDAGMSAAALADPSPVTLRNLQVATIEGNRAVLLRFSREPYGLAYTTEPGPGRLTVRASGPPGEGDLPERSLQQLDAQIADVRVSRTQGTLQVVIDFKADEVPPHSVHQMVDWVMIRLPASGTSQGDADE